MAGSNVPTFRRRESQSRGKKLRCFIAPADAMKLQKNMPSTPPWPQARKSAAAGYATLKFLYGGKVQIYKWQIRPHLMGLFTEGAVTPI